MLLTADTPQKSFVPVMNRQKKTKQLHYKNKVGLKNETDLFLHKKIKGRGFKPLPLYFDLCFFLNYYLLAVVVTAFRAKSVSSLEFTAV